MSGFAKRIDYDRIFKEIAQELLDNYLSGKVHYQNIGVEEKLSNLHEHIRFKRDLTTEFVRYTPDGFLCWDKSFDRPSCLIELKTATTGWKFDNAKPLRQMREKVLDLKKEEVVNIELGSFENMLRLRKIGINVVIWIYIAYHPVSKWLGSVDISA